MAQEASSKDKDNMFIKETSKEERTQHSSQTGKQRLRNHDYNSLAPRRKKHTSQSQGLTSLFHRGSKEGWVGVGCEGRYYRG